MDRRIPLAAAWTCALIGFVAMAMLAGANDTFPADVWLAQHFQGLESPALGFLLDVPEEISDAPLIFLVWSGATIGVLATVGWRQALLLVAAFVLRFSNTYLKDLVGRPRPSLDLVSAEHQPSGLSFPSGHAQSVVLLYGLLFYFATVYIKDVRLRTASQLFCAWVIVFTGLERVYVGHHWPSDVVGGFWFAGLMLAVLIAVDQLVFRRYLAGDSEGRAKPRTEVATP